MDEKRVPSALSTASVDDLVRELKTRCEAVVLVMHGDTPEGEGVYTFYQGSRALCIGLLEDAKHTLLADG